MRSASSYDIFVSYRRADNNPSRLREYLNAHLYQGAAYMDLYDQEMNDLALKASESGLTSAFRETAPSAVGETGDPLQVLNDRQQKVLRGRIQDATVVLILLDRNFHANFVAAGERNQRTKQIDWALREIEYVFEFNKEAILVYGYPDEKLDPAKSKSRLGDYKEMESLVDRLVLCESVVVEFSNENMVEAQLKDLVARLRPRLVRYWRHKTRDAKRSCKTWRYLSLVIGFVLLAAVSTTLVVSDQRDLSDWLRWRHGHGSGALGYKAFSRTQYIEYEKKSLGKGDDLWANEWKKFLFDGFAAKGQGGQPPRALQRELVIVESEPFDMNYRTFSVSFSLKMDVCLVGAYAFLFNSRQSPHLRTYRQLLTKPHTDCTNFGSSLVQVDSGNQYDKILLILNCEGEGVNKKSPSDFLFEMKVE